MLIKEPKVINVDINLVREYASDGYDLGEIADLLNISFQVFTQYYNKGKSGNKKMKNYVYYRSIYKAVNGGHKEYKKHGIKN